MGERRTTMTIRCNNGVMTPGTSLPSSVKLESGLIVATALRVVRAEGLPAVTMRRIADELGTAPMSLYRHVADRDDLFVSMLGDVAAQLVLPEQSNDARTELTAILTAGHDTFRADPWVLELVLLRGLASPVVLPAIERTLAALERAGLSDEEVISGYSLLWHYVYGESLAMHHERPDSYAREMIRLIDDPSLPTIKRHLDASAGPQDWFAVNLQRVLDGVLGTRDEARPDGNGQHHRHEGGRNGSGSSR